MELVATWDEIDGFIQDSHQKTWFYCFTRKIMFMFGSRNGVTGLPIEIEFSYIVFLVNILWV
jgi:hypothetical protein